MCDFSEDCKTKCLFCLSYCEDDNCNCDDSEELCKTSCSNVKTCIQEETIKEKCSDLPEICQSDCEMACPIAKHCINTDGCNVLSSSIYEFYYDKCMNRDEECAICDDFHMCFKCDEVCETTCIFSSDSECDDGGDGSLYSECAEGTDCQDCGSRLSTNCSFIPFEEHVYIPFPPPSPPPYLPYVPPHSPFLPPELPTPSIDVSPPLQYSPPFYRSPYVPPIQPVPSRPSILPPLGAAPPEITNRTNPSTNHTNPSTNCTHLITNCGMPPLSPSLSPSSPFAIRPSQLPFANNATCLQTSNSDTNPWIGVFVFIVCILFETTLIYSRKMRRSTIDPIINTTMTTPMTTSMATPLPSESL